MLTPPPPTHTHLTSVPLLQEVDRWLDFYERHDKYRYIGMLVTDPVEDALQSTLLEEDMLHSALGDAAGGTPFDQAVRFHQQGARAYRKQDLEGALSFWASALMTLGPTGGLGEEATVELRANVMLGMGAVELKRGNGWQAEEHYEETLEGLREGFGQDVADSHPLYARALSDQVRRASQAVQGLALHRDIVSLASPFRSSAGRCPLP